MRVRYYCGECLMARDFAPPFPEAGEQACARCGRQFRADFGTAASGTDFPCAFCGNRAFFLQKDFDQRLGCLIMAASLCGALVVGWRLGWIWFTPVLLATVLIDWIVAARIRPLAICYRCDAEYRDLPDPSRYKAYDPHVAERYAETKTLRRMR
jgi:DNA-directed RNA polymerase subunit RPC12/RpoP